MITAQSRLGHSSITVQVTAQSRLAVTILVTVSSPWAHREQSRWPIFFSWENTILFSLYKIKYPFRESEINYRIEHFFLCTSYFSSRPTWNGQVSYRGVQLWDPTPYPILGKAGLRKHTLFSGNLTIPGTRSNSDSENIPYFRENLLILATRSGPDSENTPYFRENFIIPGTWSGPDSKIYFREIWWNHTLF